jgi:hypothetical protein
MLSQEEPLVHIIMVHSHVVLIASSPLGHDAETKYISRKCTDKVHNLLRWRP